eukprot:gb/GECG01012672.1/.p1 GENE.gb/GECG01012672.1/~~gb/GECG01012672.1/.p1  ORF type:complete len:129 (+),score=7.35 gb/GECG01012672.1/:1-387(+)
MDGLVSSLHTSLAALPDFEGCGTILAAAIVDISIFELEFQQLNPFGGAHEHQRTRKKMILQQFGSSCTVPSYSVRNSFVYRTFISCIQSTGHRNPMTQSSADLFQFPARGLAHDQGVVQVPLTSSSVV